MMKNNNTTHNPHDYMDFLSRKRTERKKKIIVFHDEMIVHYGCLFDDDKSRLNRDDND